MPEKERLCVLNVCERCRVRMLMMTHGDSRMTFGDNLMMKTEKAIKNLLTWLNYQIGPLFSVNQNFSRFTTSYHRHYLILANTSLMLIQVHASTSLFPLKMRLIRNIVKENEPQNANFQCHERSSLISVATLFFGGQFDWHWKVNSLALIPGRRK